MSGATVVAIATFLPWYRWGQGGVRLTSFSPNLYGLGSLPGPHWNSIAPDVVEAGVALLLLSGLLLLLGHERSSRWAPAAMCTGASVVIVSSVMVRSPRVLNHSLVGLSRPFEVPRGPGLVVALAGAALGLAALVPLVARPVGRVLQDVEQSSVRPTAVGSG